MEEREINHLIVFPFSNLNVSANAKRCAVAARCRRSADRTAFCRAISIFLHGRTWNTTALIEEEPGTNFRLSFQNSGNTLVVHWTPKSIDCLNIAMNWRITWIHHPHFCSLEENNEETFPHDLLTCYYIVPGFNYFIITVMRIAYSCTVDGSLKFSFT